MRRILVPILFTSFFILLGLSFLVEPIYTREAYIDRVERLVYPRPRVQVLVSNSDRNLYIRSMQIKPLPLGGVNVSVSVYYDAFFWYANAKVVVRLYDDDGNLLDRSVISIRYIWGGSHKTGYAVINGVDIDEVKRVVARVR